MYFLRQIILILCYGLFLLLSAPLLVVLLICALMLGKDYIEYHLKTTALIVNNIVMSWPQNKTAERTKVVVETEEL